MRQHGSSIIYVTPTTSLTRLSVFTKAARSGAHQDKITALMQFFKGRRRAGSARSRVYTGSARSALCECYNTLARLPFRLTKFGSRTDKAASALTWKGLPEDVQTPTSIFCNDNSNNNNTTRNAAYVGPLNGLIAADRNRLKTRLFRRSSAGIYVKLRPHHLPVYSQVQTV